MTARVGVIGLGVIGKPIALYISTQASLIADSGHATGLRTRVFESDHQ